MMSMSGGWFFVVASESISVGHTSVTLPGIGSYIALAIESAICTAIGWAIVTMLIVILLYDQLIFRPLVAWVDRLRFEQDPGGRVPRSWALTVMQRSRLLSAITNAFYAAVRWTSWAMPIGASPERRAPRAHGAPRRLALGGADRRARGSCALEHDARARRADFDQRGRRRREAGAAHHAARVRAHRDREPGVGADRRVGGTASARARNRAARSRSFSRRFRRTCCSRWRSTASSPGN